MQLVLDIKKNSTSGEPEAYRVRVLWFLNQGGQMDAMDVDQREVVFVSGTADYMRLKET